MSCCCHNRTDFLSSGKLIDHSGHPLDIVKLRHPATGESSMFLFSPKEDSIQEVLTFSENKRYVILIWVCIFCYS